MIVIIYSYHFIYFSSWRFRLWPLALVGIFVEKNSVLRVDASKCFILTMMLMKSPSSQCWGVEVSKCCFDCWKLHLKQKICMSSKLTHTKGSSLYPPHDDKDFTLWPLVGWTEFRAGRRPIGRSRPWRRRSTAGTSRAGDKICRWSINWLND